MDNLNMSVTGETYSALVSAAKRKAAAFFEEQCVAVSLDNVREWSVDTTFTADAGSTLYIADAEGWVAHRWEQAAYGFPKCVNCKKVNYS